MKFDLTGERKEGSNRPRGENPNSVRRSTQDSPKRGVGSICAACFLLHKAVNAETRVVIPSRDAIEVNAGRRRPIVWRRCHEDEVASGVSAKTGVSGHTRFSHRTYNGPAVINPTGQSSVGSRHIDRRNVARRIPQESVGPVADVAIISNHLPISVNGGESGAEPRPRCVELREGAGRIANEPVIDRGRIAIISYNFTTGVDRNRRRSRGTLGTRIGSIEKSIGPASISQKTVP